MIDYPLHSKTRMILLNNKNLSWFIISFVNWTVPKDLTFGYNYSNDKATAVFVKSISNGTQKDEFGIFKECRFVFSFDLWRINWFNLWRAREYICDNLSRWWHIWHSPVLLMSIVNFFKEYIHEHIKQNKSNIVYILWVWSAFLD